MKNVNFKNVLVIFAAGFVGLMIGILGTFYIVNNILLEYGLEIQTNFW